MEKLEPSWWRYSLRRAKKGTKRYPPDDVAENERTSIAYRYERRYVIQADPNPDNALLPKMGYNFIDETVETIKS
jgi:hypothetical protein